MNSLIAPSILSADFGILAEEVQSVILGGADWIHVDVMDGHFVPNLTLGPLVVDALRRRSNIALDVHLMIAEPERYIDDFARAGATSITIHQEATPHVHRALQQIKAHGVRAGLALNPSTGLDGLEYVADLLDLLLVMTVNPGFGGQSFIPSSLEKIKSARERLDALNREDVLIEIDGGVSVKTIAPAFQAGARVFVAGSAIFSQTDRKFAIQSLRDCLPKA